MTRVTKALVAIGVCFFGVMLLIEATAPVDSRPANDPSRYQHYFTSEDPNDATAVTITHRVRNSTLDLAAWNLACTIWQAAQVYRQTETLQVTVVLAKEGWQDKYGRAFLSDMAMGTLSLKRQQLEEIRKYVTEEAYSRRDEHKVLYGLWLYRQPHGKSLT